MTLSGGSMGELSKAGPTVDDFVETKIRDVQRNLDAGYTYGAAVTLQRLNPNCPLDFFCDNRFLIVVDKLRPGIALLKMGFDNDGNCHMIGVDRNDGDRVGFLGGVSVVATKASRLKANLGRMLHHMATTIDAEPMDIVSTELDFACREYKAKGRTSCTPPFSFTMRTA